MREINGIQWFTVACCGKRRGLINGALICSRCDFDHDHATVVPNENKARDVPQDLKVWTPGLEPA